ncbi:MAG: YheT family hydrolase [Planctomycetota bacterium]
MESSANGWSEREEGFGVAPSYEFPTFRPFPLFSGGHAQTIAGLYVPHQHIPYAAVTHELLLPDGDRTLLHDDCPHSWQAGDPAVLLLHGLGGNHLSPYMVRAASKLNAENRRAFRLDLRGHGTAWKLARQPGHAGRSEDARAALEKILQLCPHSPIVVVGVSMGGNILLKMLGEYGPSVPENLCGALIVSPPCDLAYCSSYLRDHSLRIYSRTFLRGLMQQFRQRQELFPELREIVLPARLSSVWEFDDLVTAPLSGFRDAQDYYDQCSSAPRLKQIHLPTAILATADDPLIPVSMFAELDFGSSVRLQVMDHGGHIGFLAASGDDPDRRWLDWRILEFVDWQVAGYDTHAT